tara:strand:- start:926 stop:1117 length:192 start_codon:yes stop_codon:yes gene_type:complete
MVKILNFNILEYSKLYDSIRDGSMEDESLSSIEVQKTLADLVNPTSSQDEDIINFKKEFAYEH